MRVETLKWATDAFSEVRTERTLVMTTNAGGEWNVLYDWISFFDIVKEVIR